MLNDPYLIRIPPASIKPLSEYAVALGKRGAEYNQVLTKISFDMEAPNPKLTFKAVGLLSDKAYNEVKEAIESDVVMSILGIKGDLPLLEELPTPASKEEEAPAPKAEKPAPKAKPKAEPKPEPVVNVPADLNLDDLNFDD
jgi:hypothetical protein